MISIIRSITFSLAIIRKVVIINHAEERGVLLPREVVQPLFPEDFACLDTRRQASPQGELEGSGGANNPAAGLLSTPFCINDQEGSCRARQNVTNRINEGDDFLKSEAGPALTALI